MDEGDLDERSGSSAAQQQQQQQQQRPFVYSLLNYKQDPVYEVARDRCSQSVSQSVSA